jgi:hypothetical protein
MAMLCVTPVLWVESAERGSRYVCGRLSIKGERTEGKSLMIVHRVVLGIHIHLVVVVVVVAAAVAAAVTCFF